MQKVEFFNRYIDYLGDVIFKRRHTGLIQIGDNISIYF